mgnify:CR=1 FL=1
MIKEPIQYAFLCIGLYAGVAVVSLMLGDSIANITNEKEDAILYAWLTSTLGLAISLVYIIKNML